MSCLLGHKWSKWSVFEEGRGTYVFGGGSAYFIRQSRKCDKCGKTDIEKKVI